jgi:tetratricopeptide (TPR) repeat protein
MSDMPKDNRHLELSNQAPTETPVQKQASPSTLSLIWVGLVLLNAFVFEQVRHFDFVNFDDHIYVTENEQVLHGLTWHGLSWAFTTGHAANWHPLTWLSHMLDAQIYGLNAGGQHLTSLLFHAANTVLLFALLNLLTNAPGRSAVVAALFAIHPLHVESVAWISERKDVLSTFFELFGLLCYVRYVRTRGWISYVGLALFFAMSLMAKPMAVTLPFVLLLLDIWPLARVQLVPDWPLWRKLVTEKIPLMLLAVASSVVTILVQRHGGAVAPLDVLPIEPRVSNALVSYVAYISATLWPASMAAFYPYRSFSPFWVVGSAFVLLAVSFVALKLARLHPYVMVGWFWYVGMLVPVIGLFQVGNQSRADRYTYLPLVGIFVITTWGASELLTTLRHSRTVRAALPALAICIYAVIAYKQAGYWKDSVSLWQHALEVTKTNNVAHANLGDELLANGRFSEAAMHYTEALRIRPGQYEIENNLGNALLSHGNTDDALSHYSEAVRLNPGIAEAQVNLGMLLGKQGRIPEALPHLYEALKINPESAEAHNVLAIALAQIGRTDEAIEHYSAAVRIKPDNVQAHSNFGVLLAAQGKVDEAIREYTEALRLKPNDPMLHYKLGTMLKAKGNTLRATEEFTAAMRLQPGFAEANRPRF